jgi:nucleoside 2-deoxyribosyltransferase
MNIYFAGSIRGGRDMQPTYLEIINALKADGHNVLSEHVGADDLKEQLSDDQIFDRDMAWLKSCDCLIADVTIPSLGVGFEVGTAVRNHKPVLCIAKIHAQKVSAMITGCPDIEIGYYLTTPQAITLVRAFTQIVEGPHVSS